MSERTRAPSSVREHDDKPQVLAQALLRIERERKAEIGVERALVELVEHDRRDPLKRGIVEDLPREHALGDGLDARALRDLALQPDPKADRLADLFVQGRGHAGCGGAGGETARLEHDLKIPACTPEKSTALAAIEQKLASLRGLYQVFRTGVWSSSEPDAI